MRLYIIHSSNKEIVIKNYIRIDRLYLFDCLTHLPNNKFLLSHEQIDSNPLEDKNIPTSSISTQRVHIFPIPKSSGKISEISHFENSTLAFVKIRVKVDLGRKMAPPYTRG